MIRINPQHYYLPAGKGVSLAMGGLEGLGLIGAEMINLSNFKQMNCFDDIDNRLYVIPQHRKLT